MLWSMQAPENVDELYKRQSQHRNGYFWNSRRRVARQEGDVDE